MGAPTDGRLLWSPISSIPAVRQLSAGKSVGRIAFCLARQGGRKVENFENNGCSRSCAEKRTGEATYAHRRKCENALELQGWVAPAESPGQLIARESTLDKETALWARWGAHRERVEADADGSALEWQEGRRVSAHVQPARNFQGVSSAPGSAQHEQIVQEVSFASGRRPQLRLLGTCKCVAWAQRAGCILCTWTRAWLAAGHAVFSIQ